MTLKEAFNQWSVAPRNSVLANRSRDAVNKVLLKEYGDTDLELIDETFAREIFLGSDVAQELKTKAASILVYVLQWGGDHGHCDRPSFDYSIARKPEVKPADKPKGRKKPQKEIEPAPVQTTPDPSYSGGETSGGDEPSGKPAASDKTAAASPPELGGDRGGLNERKDESPAQTTPDPSYSGGEAAAPVKPKRTIRKVDDDICQLDLRTLAVIKRFPHPHRIMQELGIGNVARAIERCGVAGGYYWSYSRDLDTFRERLAARQQQNAKAHADHCAQMRAAKEPQNTQKAASKREESEARIDSHEREQARPQGKDTEKKSVKSVKSVDKKKAAQTTPNPSYSGGEAAAPENKRTQVNQCQSVASVANKRSAAQAALEVFTDDELFEELDRRGWHGYFSRTEIVTIGDK